MTTLEYLGICGLALLAGQILGWLHVRARQEGRQ